MGNDTKNNWDDLLFATHADAILHLDGNFNIVRCNQSCRELLDLSQDFQDGMSVELLAGFSSEQVSALKQHILEEKAENLQLKWADGDRELEMLLHYRALPEMGGLLFIHDHSSEKLQQQINDAVLRLSRLAGSVTVYKLLQAILDEAEALTSSEIGFFHFVDMEQNRLTMQAWSTNTMENMCAINERGRAYPVEKAGVWADCVREGRTVIHNDYASLPGRKGLPEGHASIVRELLTPLFQGDSIVAILAVGNKKIDYNDRDVYIIETMAALAWDTVQAKRQQEALREHDERYQMIMDSSPDAIFLVNQMGDYLYVNQAASKLLGYTRDELTQLNIRDIGEGAAQSQRFKKLLEEGQFFSEFNLRRKDGSLVPVDLNAMILPNGLVYGSCRDLTERHQAQEAMQQREGKFNALFNNVNVGIALHEIVTDDKGRPVDFIFLDANPAYESLTQLKADQIIGKRGREVIPTIEEKWIELYGQVALTGESLTITDHSEYLDKYWEVRAFSPAPGQFGVALKDITESQNAMEILRENEARVRATFNALLDAVFIHPLMEEGFAPFVEVNEVACLRYGYTHEEFLKLSAPDITVRVDAKNHSSRSTRSVLRSKGRMVFESVHITKSGEHFPVEINSSVIQLGGQDMILASVRDITERKKAEAALHESEIRYRNIVEASPIGIFFYRLSDEGELIFTGANPAASVIVGIDCQQFVGLPIEDAFPGVRGTEIPGAYRRVAEQGEPWSTDQVDYDSEGITGAYEVYAFQSEPGNVVVLFSDVTEKVAAESVRSQLKEFYETILESVHDGIWVSNRDNVITYANAGMEAIAGVSRNQIEGLNVLTDFPAETVEYFKVEYLKAVEQRWPVEYRLPVQTPAGRPSIQAGWLIPLYEGRQYNGMICTIQDVTERERVEGALKASEAKYRYLFDNSPMGVVTIDDQGGILEINQALLDILGSPSEEATRQINVLTYPLLVDSGTSERFQNCLDTGEHYDFETQYTSKWGKTAFLNYHMAPIQNANGATIGVQATVQDVTQRKQAEEQLKKSYQDLKENQRALINLMEDLTLEIQDRKRAEEQLQEAVAKLNSILGAAPIGIGLVVERCFTQVNQTFCDMLGFSESELIGQSSRMIYPDDETYARVGADKYRQIKERGTGTVETPALRKDGSIIDILLSSTPLDQQDWGKGVTFTALDITERNRYLSQIEGNLKEKEMLLKEIHHRVKNNLQIISSLLSLQSMKIENEDLKEIIQESRNRIYSMSLVHERLYGSKDFSSIDFSDYIRSVTRELFDSYDYTHRVALDLDVEEIDLGIDTAIPCGLLINEMVTNSLKHAFPNEREGRVRIEFNRRPDRYFLLKVCDNGVGIGDLESVRAKGSLGMELIDVLTGQLEGTCQIKLDQGTCFEIVFPDPDLQDAAGDDA